MNAKRQPSRGPRPNPGMKPGSSKHYWNRRCWPWHHYNYDWYDYDYDYDWYDYDYDSTDWDFYSSQRRAKPGQPVKMPPVPIKAWEEGTDEYVIEAYQQGFRDGWVAAMDYAIYGAGPKPVEPEPVPVSPTPAPETKTV